ncbi:MAG: NAD-dependent epimerase/dehydratase family protein [Planctomycetota bacterium]
MEGPSGRRRQSTTVSSDDDEGRSRCDCTIDATEGATVNCLVTGGGGFIGGHLVKRLLEQGHSVRAVDIKPLDQWWQRFGTRRPACFRCSSIPTCCWRRWQPIRCNGSSTRHQRVSILPTTKTAPICPP